MTDTLTVTRLRERETPESFAFEVRNGERAYQCEVSRRIASDTPSAVWWGSRGNADNAEYEAVQWAENEARRMAESAFRRDVSVICRECGDLVGGVEAGDAVRWTVCPACESDSDSTSVVLAVDQRSEAECLLGSPPKTSRSTRDAMTSHPIPARGETTALIVNDRFAQNRPLAEVHALPVEPAGTPDESVISQDADLVRQIARDAQRRPLSSVEAVYLNKLAASLAALTSEVSRLQKNWDEAYEVHESDKIEIIDLRAEVSALREAVDALTYIREVMAGPGFRVSVHFDGAGLVGLEWWAGPRFDGEEEMCLAEVDSAVSLAAAVAEGREQLREAHAALDAARRDGAP